MLVLVMNDIETLFFPISGKPIEKAIADLYEEVAAALPVTDIYHDAANLREDYKIILDISEGGCTGRLERIRRFGGGIILPSLTEDSPTPPDLAEPIMSLPLSTRAKNALINKLGCRTLGDVLKVSEADVRSCPWCGKVTADEVKNFLALKGYKFARTL